jgi:hypothetical protein
LFMVLISFSNLKRRNVASGRFLTPTGAPYGSGF